ncbi:hypothetical protein AB4Z54_17800 [Streptomyces sp. MCAF7]
MTRQATITAGLIAAGLLLAGCASSDDQDKKESKPTEPKAAVLKAARTYQEAANRLDWRTACTFSSRRLRDGTVAECADRNVGPASPTPSQTTTASESASPSPSVSPPTYADGSTPDPLPSRTSTGPDRATLGPVTAGGIVKVPAVGDHPAGYGVLITYTVHWPGKPAATTRRALRLVSDGGAWRVDQHEDVQDGDMGHGSPVLAALSRG